jgi:(S)-ureidoglycine aminohydrolase
MIIRVVILLIGFSLPGFSLPGYSQQVVAGGVYPWPKLNEGESSQDLFSGKTNVLDYLSMSASSIKKEKDMTIRVPNDEEHLLLIKSGQMEIQIADSAFQIGLGSVALIKSDDVYRIQTIGEGSSQYHIMKYRGKILNDFTFQSFVMDWSKLKFNPHDRGGVRPYFDKPTTMVKRFEMHATTLNEGLMSHQPHTHGAEEIILVLEGEVEMLIGENTFKGKKGDVFFVPTKAPHNLKNIGKGQCSYFAYQWD